MRHDGVASTVAMMLSWVKYWLGLWCDCIPNPIIPNSTFFLPNPPNSISLDYSQHWKPSETFTERDSPFSPGLSYPASSSNLERHSLNCSIHSPGLQACCGACTWSKQRNIGSEWGRTPKIAPFKGKDVPTFPGFCCWRILLRFAPHVANALAGTEGTRRMPQFQLHGPVEKIVIFESIPKTIKSRWSHDMRSTFPKKKKLKEYQPFHTFSHFFLRRWG